MKIVNGCVETGDCSRCKASGYAIEQFEGRDVCVECCEILKKGEAVETVDPLVYFIRTESLDHGVQEVEEFIGSEIAAAPAGWTAAYADPSGKKAAVSKSPIACWVKGLSKFWRFPNDGKKEIPLFNRESWVLMSREMTIHGLVSIGAGFDPACISNNFVGYYGPGEEVIRGDLDAVVTRLKER